MPAKVISDSTVLGSEIKCLVQNYNKDFYYFVTGYIFGRLWVSGPWLVLNHSTIEYNNCY